MKNLLTMLAKTVFLTACVLLFILQMSGCTHTKAQKTPWAVGYQVLYFQNNGLDYNAKLQVDKVWLDNTEEYDGAFHYKYDVHEIDNGAIHTGVIDYQLGTKKWSDPLWTKLDKPSDALLYKLRHDSLAEHRVQLGTAD